MDQVFTTSKSDDRASLAASPLALGDGSAALADPGGLAGAKGQGERSDRLPSRTARRLVSVALTLGDAATFALAYLMVAAAMPAAPRLQAIAVVLAIAAVTLYAGEGLYPGYRLEEHERLRRRLSSAAKIGVVSCAAALILAAGATETLQVGLLFVVAICLQPPMQSIVRRILRGAELWGERAVVVAPQGHDRELVEYFNENWQIGVRAEIAPREAGCERQGPPNGKVPMALVAHDAISLQDIAELKQKYDHFVLLADSPIVRNTGFSARDCNGEIGIAVRRETPRATLLARVFDLAIALPAAILALPVMALAALAIYIVDPGPVLYRHAREGRNGEPLRVLKLRTMYRDAEARLEQLLESDWAAREEWARTFKLRRDPRILPWVGNLLRSLSLDELPQLFNIIAGQMRVVGPRPFPEYHLAAMDPGFRARRSRITPGLTGLWQVSARSDADTKLQQMLDEYYINNKSFWFDLQIIFKTVSAVLRRTGAY